MLQYVKYTKWNNNKTQNQTYKSLSEPVQSRPGPLAPKSDALPLDKRVNWK